MFTVALLLLFLAFLLNMSPTIGAEDEQESTTEDLSKILGKFQRYSVDKYDEFLDALGVNLVKRKALVAADPILEIRKSGNTWTNIVSTPLKNWEYTYVCMVVSKMSINWSLLSMNYRENSPPPLLPTPHQILHTFQNLSGIPILKSTWKYGYVKHWNICK